VGLGGTIREGAGAKSLGISQVLIGFFNSADAKSCRMTLHDCKRRVVPRQNFSKFLGTYSGDSTGCHMKRRAAKVQIQPARISLPMRRPPAGIFSRIGPVRTKRLVGAETLGIYRECSKGRASRWPREWVLGTMVSRQNSREP